MGTTLPERFSLTGKRALVTGASRGIGAEIAVVFAEAGADLAIVGRDKDGLAATSLAVTDKGRRCCVIEAELQTVEGPGRAGETALEFFGGIDILVNNAGVVHVASLLETTIEQWEHTQAVNLRAPFLLAQIVAPGMIERRSGKIVNISSLAAGCAPEGHAAYSASKAGLNLLTQAMACEWARHNVQANAIAPTIVMTAMGRQVWSDPAKGDPMKARIPAHRFGEPVEIADLALYLASPASNFVCGQVIYIDGGFSAV
jgi:NAD(P)-dependent dehydrogenase (short-subunit alcohol dehydrogenase family)